MRKLIAALTTCALVLGATTAAFAQEALETWETASPRTGPWAEDVAALTEAYEEEDWIRLRSMLDATGPRFADLYGQASPAYAEYLSLRGLLEFESENEEASLRYFRQAAQRFEEALGPEHRDVAIAFHTYADALMETRPNKSALEAEHLYRRAFNIRTRILGAGAIETVAVGNRLAETMAQRAASGNNRLLAAQAEYIARNVAAAARPEYGVDYTNAHIILAEILVQQGRLQEAEATLRRALQTVPTMELREALAGMLDAQGRAQEGAALRALNAFEGAGGDT
jgi:tetratricopeptide (TPR) repeat protein